TLNNVTVSDPMITPNSNSCATLAPGATCVLVGTYVVQQSDVDNGSITNTGTGDSDETPPDDDTVITLIGSNPALETDKSYTSNADEDGSGTITVGDTLTFTIVVTNIGNITLTQVTVTDNMITPNSTVCPVVPVGNTCVLVGTYVVQQSDVDNGEIINVAEGDSIETGPDPDSDIEIVIISGPSPVQVPLDNKWLFLLLLIAMSGLAAGRLQQKR
ncbi:hypothetical protein ACFODZ_14175, partial [Marinicella sediminis]